MARNEKRRKDLKVPSVAATLAKANTEVFAGSLIRNDNLAPDWLRIGTDITLQGPFNASFSLSGETDADGDGVGDCLDQCAGTSPGAIVDPNRLQHQSTRAL